MKRGRISSVLLWSVISAAFIGPGTITTAISAGSRFQLDLIWVIGFATIACVVIQELAARITITTGFNMGQAMTLTFGQRRGTFLKFLTGWIVISGCAAYEAGNIMGAVSGLRLLADIHSGAFTTIISLLALLILWKQRPQWISGAMIFFVGLMGISFVVLALDSSFSILQIVKSGANPSVPAGASLIIVGLLGTTIVPYNIFLGSGISRGQTLPLMRLGLTVSIVTGGLITIAILIAGSSIRHFSDFADAKMYFQLSMGPVGVFALSAGLFAAGFSSAVTAPYAASVIASSVFEWDKKKARWIWVFVLLTGFIFGVSGFRPVPVILAVQAMNGLILPLLVILMFLIVNNKQFMPREHRPGVAYNSLLILILIIVIMISGNNIYSAWLRKG